MAKQTNRFSDTELALIKVTFAENEDLLKAIRKHFLQLPLSAVDQAVLLNTFKDREELLNLMRKAYLPEIDGNAPIHQVVDLMMTLKIDDKSPEQAAPHVYAREKLIRLIDEMLLKLAGQNVTNPVLLSSLRKTEGKDSLATYCDLITRNTYIQHNEQQLAMFALLAGKKDETPEQTMDRLKRDSTK